MQTPVYCCTLWLSRLTARSAFLLSVNLTLQTLDAMCQNTLQCLSQNHANLLTSYRKKSVANSHLSPSAGNSYVVIR